MADQTSVNGGVKTPVQASAGEGVVGSLAEFSSNVATLAELQAQLGAKEAQIFVRRVTPSAGLVGGGAVLLLASLPVVLLGVAEWLTSAQGFSRTGSLLTAGGCAAALAAGLAFAGVRGFRHSLESFRYTTEEFTRNVAWIKTVLAHSGRAASRRRFP